MKALLCLVLLLVGGCRYVSYNSPDGRQLRIVAVGVDSSIGELEASTPQGSVKLKGYDSKAKALDLARSILDAAK